MPSEKVLEKKKQRVSEIAEQLNGSISGVLVDYKGITVENDTKLRAELREAGVSYAVIKNSLLSRACEEVGYGELTEILVGSTAVALSEEDAIAPAKIVAKYAKQLNEHFEIKGGFVEGRVVDLTEINRLAELPSREELIAKALGSMNAPISGLVTVLNGNIRGLAIALNQIVQQKAAE